MIKVWVSYVHFLSAVEGHPLGEEVLTEISNWNYVIGGKGYLSANLHSPSLQSLNHTGF